MRRSRPVTPTFYQPSPGAAAGRLAARASADRLDSPRPSRQKQRPRRGNSSVGRASASQAEGRRFESGFPLQFSRCDEGFRGNPGALRLSGSVENLARAGCGAGSGGEGVGDFGVTFRSWGRGSVPHSRAAPVLLPSWATGDGSRRAHHESCAPQRGRHVRVGRINRPRAARARARDAQRAARPRTNKVEGLLRSIGGIELVPLARPDECCGFEGTFAIAEEAVSAFMGRDRIADHARAGAEIVTGTDVSCLMHLEGLARREKSPLRFMHVAEVLAEAQRVGRIRYPGPAGRELRCPGPHARAAAADFATSLHEAVGAIRRRRTAGAHAALP